MTLLLPFPSFQIVFKYRTIFINCQRTSYKSSSLIFPAPAELGECEGSPASRSDGICFSCGPPVKTQRAFHLQKNQVSRYLRIHTCKKGTPWVPSVRGQEYNLALEQRRGMGNQETQQPLKCQPSLGRHR